MFILLRNCQDCFPKRHHHFASLLLPPNVCLPIFPHPRQQFPLSVSLIINVSSQSGCGVASPDGSGLHFLRPISVEHLLICLLPICMFLQHSFNQLILQFYLKLALFGFLNFLFLNLSFQLTHHMFVWFLLKYCTYIPENELYSSLLSKISSSITFWIELTTVFTESLPRNPTCAMILVKVYWLL